MPEAAHGWRLDKALGLLLPETDWGLRARRRLCERGLVLVGRKTGTPGTKVRAGQEITLLSDSEGAAATGALSNTALPDARLAISAPESVCLVANDVELAAVFKPAGLHTVALTGSLAPCLEVQLPALLAGLCESLYRPQLLNRLDAPTSGLVLVALAREGELRWRRAERLGYTDKHYLAIIEGQPLYDFSVCRRLDTDNRIRTRVRSTDDPDTLRHTDITLLHAFTLAEAPGLADPAALPEQTLTLVGCRIRKGARHQIRAHLAAAGHPLFGDVLYGGTALPQNSFFLHHGQVSLPGFEASCRAPWLDLLPEHVRNLDWPQR